MSEGVALCSALLGHRVAWSKSVQISSPELRISVKNAWDHVDDDTSGPQLCCDRNFGTIACKRFYSPPRGRLASAAADVQTGPMILSTSGWMRR
jgi:hypothetical protein